MTWILLSSLVLPALTGCIAPPSGIATVEVSEQEDIPVPKRFELRHSISPKSSVESNFRSWTGEYIGPEPVGSMVPWYVTEMQTHQWVLRRIVETGQESRRLFFEKEDESSVVDISRAMDRKQGGFVTHVKVRVGPRGPEEYTVDEHLRFKEHGVRPAAAREVPREDLEGTFKPEPAVDPGIIPPEEIAEETRPAGKPRAKQVSAPVPSSVEIGESDSDAEARVAPATLPRSPVKVSPTSRPTTSRPKSSTKDKSDLQEIEAFEKVSR